MNGGHQLFRIMVWDAHPIIYLHPTTEKKKVLVPPRNNREEIATSTQSSLQVQRASVARMTPTVNISDFVILSFFLVFSQKLRGRVTRNMHMALPTQSALTKHNFFHRSKLKKSLTTHFSSCIDEDNRKPVTKSEQKWRLYKPFDQNAENGEKIDCLDRPCPRPAPVGKIESVRTHSEIIEQLDSFSLLKLLFLVRNWHCGSLIKAGPPLIWVLVIFWLFCTMV